MSKASTMPMKRENLNAQFLIKKCYRSCDAGLCITCDGSNSILPKPQALSSATSRPLFVVGELARNSTFLIYGAGTEPYLEYSTLFKVCLQIFKQSCKKPTRRLIESQVLTSVGYLLLRIAFSDIRINCQGVPQFTSLSSREKWECMYTTIEGALHVLDEDDTMGTWYEKLSECDKPV